MDIVKYLCERGADILSLDNLAVRLASQNGHLEVIMYLFRLGADISKISEKHQKYQAYFYRVDNGGV